MQSTPRTVIPLLVISLLTITHFGQSQSDSGAGEKPLQIHVLYIGDGVTNVLGGIKTGACFMGMADLTLGYAADRDGILAGGSAFVKVADTHGSQASAAFIGDYQVASNIEAGNHLYLQEAWYRQTVGDAAITVGLQDMNGQFAVNDNSGMYLNSSFGVHPTLSHNVPAPIFPLTALGAACAWNVSDRLRLLGAVFDGAPISFDSNPYNLKWRFNASRGLLMVAEGQAVLGSGGQSVVKAGWYHHTKHAAEADDALADETNYGMYATLDLPIAGAPHSPGSMAGFVRVSISPRSVNDNYFFFGAGMNVCGLMRDDGADVAGLALARVWLDGIDDETAIELTYQLPLYASLTLQPDLQYIINPSGTGTVLPSSLTGTLRVGVHF